MAQLVTRDQQGSVALVRMNNGAANALTPAMRRQILAELERAQQDPSIVALVLAGQPGNGAFSTGLELGELEGSAEAPTLADLCTAIAAAQKPVVAALQGTVLNGGLDLALAAQGRVALANTHVGYPNTLLGLLPVAGATQRLPALLGANAAVTLLRGEQLHPIRHPSLAGLVQEVASENVEKVALALARLWGDHPEQVREARQRQPGFRDAYRFQSEINDLREEAGTQRPPSDQRLIDCVEASLLLPLEAGLSFEAAATEDCRTAPSTAGLLHAQRAKRNASKFPRRDQGTTRQITRLGMVGGGIPALSLALLAARRGLSVQVFERNEEVVQEAQVRLEELVQRRAGRADQAALLGRIRVSSELGALAQADMVIEAVAENLETKKQIFAALDLVLDEEAIRVTQSTLLGIDDIAASSKHPQNVLGMCFHQPVLARELVELLPGSETDPDVLSTAAGFAASLGRIALYCGSGGGTIGEPMMAALRETAWYYLLQGISPYEIDRILVEFGLPLGVFGALDRQGLDVALKRMQLLYNRKAYPSTFMTLLKLMLDKGRKGEKHGQGFYRWRDSETPLPDPELAEVLNEGEPWRKPPSDAEILRVMLAAMANQGARLLRNEVAVRPSDIDAVMVLGHQFPATSGGPMKAAQMHGMFRILQELKARAGEMPTLFEPEPGIAALVKNGETFDSLNRLGRQRKTLPI